MRQKSKNVVDSGGKVRYNTQENKEGRCIRLTSRAEQRGQQRQQVSHGQLVLLRGCGEHSRFYLDWRCFGISKVQHQLNEEINDKEIRLIGEGGEQMGIVSGEEALRIAEEHGLDLVKISPQATPPVCKLMNYGKYKFEQSKREKEARKTSTWWRSRRSGCPRASTWAISTPS